MSSTGCILFRLEESLKELAEKSLERWILAISTANRKELNELEKYAFGRAHTYESLKELREDMGSCLRAYQTATFAVSASGGPRWHEALICLAHAMISESRWNCKVDSVEAMALVRQARIDYYAAQEAGQ